MMIKIHDKFHNDKVPPVNEIPKIITHNNVGTDKITWVIHCITISAFEPAKDP
jgi:hypothetical protein